MITGATIVLFLFGGWLGDWVELKESRVEEGGGLEGLELPEFEGAERVKEPPLLRPALLFA